MVVRVWNESEKEKMMARLRREASKEKIKRQLEISGKTATDEELEQMLEVIIQTYSHPIFLKQFKTLFSSIQTLDSLKLCIVK